MCEHSNLFTKNMFLHKIVSNTQAINFIDIWRMIFGIQIMPRRKYTCCEKYISFKRLRI
jgi:hypothetical protein